MHLPNQMIRMFPVKEDYISDQITAFPLQVVTHRSPGIFQMKVTRGEITGESWKRKMNIDHDLEEVHPWLYSTWLIDDNIRISFAPGIKTAIYKIDFHGADQGNLLMKGSDEMKSGSESSATFRLEESIKYTTRGIFAETRVMKAFVFGQICGADHKPYVGAVINSGKGKFSIYFSGNVPSTVYLKYAVSYISYGQAEKNFSKELNQITFDDHAYQAISAYSDKLMQTPNIDRIATEGMLFTNACVTNSICSPSRATILTGKHCHMHGKTDNVFPFDTTQVTFPQLLQEAGYQTALFGKLHFGNNPKGFDEFKILIDQGNYYNPDFITRDEGKIRVEGYTTDIITDMTLNWLKEKRNPGQPFLMMYLHKAPHREWLPAPRHFRDFTKKTFPEPETLFDNYSGRGTAAHAAEINILTHMNWAGDSKIRPELMDELGIPEAYNWDKGAFAREVGRMNPAQRAEWDAVYDPINEGFRSNGQSEYITIYKPERIIGIRSLKLKN